MRVVTVRTPEAPSPLRAGVGVDLRDPGLASLPARVALSSGTRASGGPARGYLPGTFVPRSPWRNPSALELALLAAGPAARPAARVEVVRLPSAALRTLHGVGLPGALDRATPARLSGIRRRAAALRAFQDALATWAVTRNGAAVGGIFCNPPGLETVTFDAPRGGFVGLHVDVLYGAPLDRAHKSPGRLCANVGTQPRAFLFINLTLAELAASVGRRLADSAMTTTELAATFLGRFPAYPVVKLQVAPGEAYIAPTENIIHDGSTIAMTAEDGQVMLRGSFDRRLDQQAA